MRLRRMRSKICLVGDRGVGKTSLIKRYAEGKFQPDEKGTLGAHLYPVEVDIPLDDKELVRVQVALFDFMGERALRQNFRDAMFYGAHGALAVCDLGRPDTLYALVDWVQAVTLVTGNIPMAIVLNKADLGQEIAIGTEEMRWLREQFPLAPSTITSARTGQGVEQTFSGLIARTVDRFLESQRKAQANRLLRQGILSAIAYRESVGMSKREIIEAFKSTDPKDVMQEVDNLVALKLIQPEADDSETFAKTEAIPVTSRFLITDAGRKAVAEPEAADSVIDETL